MWDPEAGGVDTSRVGEVVAVSTRGTIRGSGCLLAHGVLLTAWHVVADATSVRVVFQAGSTERWSAQMLNAIRIGLSDVALLELDLGWPKVKPVPIGGLGPHGRSLPADVVGFPRWKIRNLDGTFPEEADGKAKYRVCAQVPARLISGSNARESACELIVDPPAEERGGGASPWEGMSGAPVFCDGAVVGVVTDHHPREGLGRLSAARLDMCLERLDQGAAAIALPLLGLTSVRQVIEDVRGYDLTAEHQAGSPRSYYLYQVTRIAPSRLIERERELKQLADFCLTSISNSYLVCRAPAWSGKTALLSWFVLHPPPGIQLVSFFITARYAGQNDRIAFIDGVLDQLCALVHRRPPSLLTEATRDAVLLGMLSEAANVCQRRGERLVLVVDGLDEDRSVTAGPDAYSIAALLPAEPPGGMRIVVAGRCSPTLPEDVPDHHPLRDPASELPLSASPYAQVVKVDMERELDRLLGGGQIEQDLLGLITAAGGGLSGPDLAELTGLTTRLIHKHMNTVAGRTFARRASMWQPGTAAEAYALAHEDLQMTAVDAVGDASLVEYRRRIKDWADRFRAHGWPVDTPEYLLLGYPRMLHATQEFERLAVCATDAARHDRLFALTGSDSQAMTEIVAAQQGILQSCTPDLLTLARLVVHRDFLTSRNADLPASLPAVWGKLGEHLRAESTAQCLLWTTPISLNPAMQSRIELVDAVASTGDHRWAEEIARSIESEHQQRAQALATLARVCAESGDISLAHRLVAEAETEYRIQNPSPEVANSEVLTQLARATELLGDVNRSAALAREASHNSAIANDGYRSFLDKEDRHEHSRATMAQYEARLGNYRKSEELLASVEPGLRGVILLNIARSLASRPLSTDLDEALGWLEPMVRSIDSPARRASALANLARVLANSGRADRAWTLAREAEVLARTASARQWYAHALTQLREAIASADNDGKTKAEAHLIQLAKHKSSADTWKLVHAATMAPNRDHQSQLHWQRRKLLELLQNHETQVTDLSALPSDLPVQVITKLLMTSGFSSRIGDLLLDQLIHASPAIVAVVAEELLNLAH